MVALGQEVKSEVQKIADASIATPPTKIVTCYQCNGEITKPDAPTDAKQSNGNTPLRVAWWRGLLSFPGAKPYLEKKRKKAPASVHTAWARHTAQQIRYRKNRSNSSKSPTTTRSISKTDTCQESGYQAAFTDIYSAAEINKFDRQSIILRGDYEQELNMQEERAMLLQQQKSEKAKEVCYRQNILREKHAAWQNRKNILSENGSAPPGQDPAPPSTKRSVGLSASRKKQLDRRNSGGSPRGGGRTGGNLPAVGPQGLNYAHTFSQPVARSPRMHAGPPESQPPSKDNIRIPVGRGPSRAPSKDPAGRHQIERPRSKEQLSPKAITEKPQDNNSVNSEDEEFHFETVLDDTMRGGTYTLAQPVSFKPDDKLDEALLEICRSEELDIFEVDKMRRIFDKHDLDHSGYIGEDEFRGLIYTMNNCQDQYDLPETRLKHLWNTVDLDRNHRIDFLEFVQWWSKYSDLFEGAMGRGEVETDGEGHLAGFYARQNRAETNRRGSLSSPKSRKGQLV